jgi:3-dehydroquinate synthase
MHSNTKTIHISVSRGEAVEPYQVWIGRNILSGLGNFLELKRFDRFHVLADQNVASQHLEAVATQLKPVTVSHLQISDTNKDVRSLEVVWESFVKARLTRKSLIINLGGGALCDLGAFAAATYMRGCNFFNCPTTLLSQVDASIGGKTGINFADIKNLIGSFRQPVGVIADVATLKTLPKREFLSGFAEVIKHAFIADGNSVKFLKDSSTLFTNPKNTEESNEILLSELITSSLSIKAGIVYGDELELKGKRKLLNFGHTFGHAVEAHSLSCDHKLLHGEAISIGMSAEAEISARLGLVKKDVVDNLRECLELYELPTTLPLDYEFTSLWEKILSDKKNDGDTVRWTLLNGEIGGAVFDKEVPQRIVAEVFDGLKEK